MIEQQTLQKIAAWRAELDKRGETVADYCRKNDLDYDAMYMVLRGRSQGRRGKAHKVYVALGLKHGMPDCLPDAQARLTPRNCAMQSVVSESSYVTRRAAA